MSPSNYFRYPHLHQDMVTFVAQDDVWIAPLSGGRAWRVSAEATPVRNPRFTPDGGTLVWSVTRGEAPEVVCVPVDGGDVRQLTHWGHATTVVKGFTADGRILVTSAFEQPDSRLTQAYAVALDGSRTALGYGPVDSAAYGPVVGDERPVVLSSALSREPAAWKRYRGGTAGKLWIDTDGSGEFARLAPELDGNLCNPMWIEGRIAFLSDHEGHGNLYSVLPDGSGLHRHTDFEGFYVRHATTDGTRVVFESAGNLFVLDGLDAEARQLDITLGSAAQARAQHLLDVPEHLGDVVPVQDGRASVLEAHGTLHLLTHSDGPSRVIAAEPGVRARLGRPLGDGHVFYVADAGGQEALYIRTTAAPAAPPKPGSGSGSAVSGAASEGDANAAGAGAAEGSDGSGPGNPDNSGPGASGAAGSADIAEGLGGGEGGGPELPRPVSAQAVNAEGFNAAGVNLVHPAQNAPTAVRAAVQPAGSAQGNVGPGQTSVAAGHSDAGHGGTAGDAASNGTAPDGTAPDGTASDGTGAGGINGGTDGAAAAGSAPAATPAAAPAAAGFPAAPEELRRVDFPNPTRAAEAVGSPDGSRIAVGTEFGEVFLVDVAAGTMELVARTAVGAVEELAFSPDSGWLAWVEPLDGEGPRTRIRLANVANGQPSGRTGSKPSTATEAPGERAVIELTDGRFADHSPSFTPDGKFLAFLSQRSFDPVYDTHSFDLSFPASTRPYLVALAAATPSPFGPHPDGAPHPGRPGQAPSGQGASAQGAQITGSDAGAGGAEAAVEPVQVDATGLPARIIAVPVPQGRYKSLAATDGALLWLVDNSLGTTGDGLATTASDAPAASLERFELATAEKTRLVEELDTFRLSGDGRWVVAVHGKEVRVFDAAEPAKDAPAPKPVDLERVIVTVDPVKVWGQAFDEAWRLQRDFFYTPDMAGNDWQGVHERYRPIVERLGSHDDLLDLLWELHGELGTSHAYVSPKPVTQPGAGAQGHLGAVFEAVDGGVAVREVMGGESSDPQAFSPLAAPGVAVVPGEILEAINGVPVPAAGPEALLAGTAGRIVELSLRSQPRADGGAPTRRRVAVVPLKSEERLRYQQWVAANRATVRKASNGAFGYLHVPDMMPHGWAQLHRDLATETALDALVVDVRRNRGGHTSELVAEVIGRRMDAWNLPRGIAPLIYPAQAPRGPVVLLTDEFAGSDGDIITAVTKLRGLGPVVGMRTWGGVVGIDGRFQLADGTGVTQPRYAFWFRDGQGFGVENHGVDPDIEVPFPPHDHLAGNDPQLEAAIGVLLEMQREIPTVRPPELKGFGRTAPAPLPPRP